VFMLSSTEWVNVLQCTVEILDSSGTVYIRKQLLLIVAVRHLTGNVCVVKWYRIKDGVWIRERCGHVWSGYTWK